MFRNEGIALADWILPIAAVLTYICIFACRCRRKAKNSECVVLLLVVASTAPFLLVNYSAMTFFFLAFYFFLLKYFDDLYEKRLWKLGKSANHLAEYQPQCRLLLFFADEISKHLRKNDFYLYSPKRGKQAIQTLTVGNISLLADKHIDDVLIQALRFIHSDISEKWGEPSRVHSVMLLVERLNRNAWLYLNTTLLGNMADINQTAKENLIILFGIYYRDFHLNTSEEAQWKSAEAFAALHRKFEKSLMKFPLRLELSYPINPV